MPRLHCLTVRSLRTDRMPSFLALTCALLAWLFVVLTFFHCYIYKTRIHTQASTCLAGLAHRYTFTYSIYPNKCLCARVSVFVCASSGLAWPHGDNIAATFSLILIAGRVGRVSDHTWAVDVFENDFLPKKKKETKILKIHYWRMLNACIV